MVFIKMCEQFNLEVEYIDGMILGIRARSIEEAMHKASLIYSIPWKYIRPSN